MSCADTQAEINALEAANTTLAAAVTVDQAAVQVATAAVSAALQQLGACNTKLANDQQQIQTNNSTISMLKMMLQMNGC